MDEERWRRELPTLETLTCGCKIVWHPDTHIPPGLLRCALHRSASELLKACKVLVREDGHYLKCPCPPGYDHMYMPHNQTVRLCTQLRAAIAKAEPKEPVNV